MRSLREIHCGAVEGTPLAQVERTYPELWSRNLSQIDDEFRWPGGETYAAFRRRVIRAMRVIAGTHAGGQVLIFTHAGCVNQLLGWMHGQSAARWENFRPGNASLTRVSVSADRWMLDSFDERTHLTS
jgi:broad specificity phosphatase PhoE